MIDSGINKEPMRVRCKPCKVGFFNGLHFIKVFQVLPKAMLPHIKQSIEVTEGIGNNNNIKYVIIIIIIIIPILEYALFSRISKLSRAEMFIE